MLAIIRAAWVEQTQDLLPEAEAALWRLLVAARGPEFELPAEDAALAWIAKCDPRTWRARIRPALTPFLDMEFAHRPRIRASLFVAGDASPSSTHVSASTRETREPEAAEHVRTNTEPASSAPGGASGPAMSHPHAPTHPPIHSSLASSFPQPRPTESDWPTPPLAPPSLIVESNPAAHGGRKFVPAAVLSEHGVVVGGPSRFGGWTSDEFFEWLYATHPRPRYERKARRRWRHLQINDGDVANYDRIGAELEWWCAVTWIDCEPQHIKDLWSWLQERVWEDHE